MKIMTTHTVEMSNCDLEIIIFNAWSRIASSSAILIQVTMHYLEGDTAKEAKEGCLGAFKSRLECFMAKFNLTELNVDRWLGKDSVDSAETRTIDTVDYFYSLGDEAKDIICVAIGTLEKE